MLGSLILGFVVFLALGKLLRWFKKGKEQSAEIAAVFGLGLAITNYCTIKLPAVLAVLMIIVAIFGMCYLFKFWKEEGDTLKEAALYLLVNFIVCITLNNAAVRMRDLTSVKWVIASFDSIAKMAFIVMAGFMVANVIKFRRELGLEEGKGDDEDDDEEDKEEYSFFKKVADMFWA